MSSTCIGYADRDANSVPEPGGFLQWDELDAASTYIEKTDPAVSTTAIETLFRTFAMPKGVRGPDE